MSEKEKSMVLVNIIGRALFAISLAVFAVYQLLFLERWAIICTVFGAAIFGYIFVKKQKRNFGVMLVHIFQHLCYSFL